MAPGDWSVFAWHAANLPTMPEAEDIGNEAAGGRFGVSIRSAGYLRKWFLLGITIGVIAGLGAVVFYLALKYTSEFLLGYLADYQIPTPVGEGGHRGSTGFARPWAIPLVTTGGAVLSALIVAKLAPEATGHGTDEAIESVHGDPRAIRGRAVLVKMVASALTIGSGGSGGREGPTAQISAGFCSLLTRRLNLSNEDGRTAVALGIGAGIGAIFAAPLGGAALGASIPYRDDFDYRNLLPGFIASGTAYAVLGAFLGFDPLFGYMDAEYRFEVDIGAMKLPGRDVTPHLGRRRHPHAGWRRTGGLRSVLGHQQPPRPKRVGAGYPLLDDRRDQGFQHLAGAAQAQVRQPAVRGGHGRMQRHEIAGIVGGAQHGGRHVDKLLGTAAPRHATGGVAPSTADPRGDRPGGQQAGPPDSAVTGDPKAWILLTATQRRQGVREAGRPREGDHRFDDHVN